MEVADVAKGHCGVAVADMKLFDLEAQPVRIESDIADGDRAMERLRDLSGQHVAQDDRNSEKAEQPEENDYDGDGDTDTAKEARRASPLNLACDPSPEALKSMREYRHGQSASSVWCY